MATAHDPGVSALDLAARPAPPEVRVECARLARRLRDACGRSVGLAPAGDDVAIPPLAVQLGRSLAEQGAGPVAVLDACGSWPCARALVAAAAQDAMPLATTWVLDDLAVLTPRSPDRAAALEPLRAAVADRAAAFERLVVDLTGLDHLGEQVAACDLLDAVALVARSGCTTARDVARWLRDLPPGRGLGVLLTGV